MKKYLYIMFLALPSVLCGSSLDELKQKGLVFIAPSMQQPLQSGYVVSQQPASNEPMATQSSYPKVGGLYIPTPGAKEPADIPVYAR